MAEASNFLIGANDEHGMNPPTAGKRTPIMPYIGRSFYENEFNRQAKNYFIEACLRCGFNVFNVNPETTDTPISTRVVRVNRAGLSLVVTFAYNAYGTGTSFNSTQGIEVYYSAFNPYPAQSRNLSQIIFDTLVRNTGRPGRFVGSLSVGMTSNVNCPASLIEAGFMTNFTEAKLMLNPRFTKNVGESTCQAVCQYLDVQYIEPSNLSAYPTLRQGSRGNGVVMLQYMLNRYGYNLATDGVFGAGTMRAVMNFQANNNLSQDGIVGRNTWSALANLDPTSKTLRQGSKQSAVLYLQYLLLSFLYPITSLDGSFGPETLRAVQAFQTENGLTADGVVGPQTWRALTTSTGRPLP